MLLFFVVFFILIYFSWFCFLYLDMFDWCGEVVALIGVDSEIIIKFAYKLINCMLLSIFLLPLLL